MQRLLFCSGLLCVTLVTSFTLASTQPATKQPVPEKKALSKAEELVNDIFKEDIAKAQDAEARTKLAVYLVQQGDECGDDAAARYVLYRQARDLAVEAGNPVLTLSTIEKLVLFFEVPSFELKTEAMSKLVQNVSAKEPSKALTDLTLALITEALAADNFEAAVLLGKVATVAAKNAKEVALANTVAKRNIEIKAALDNFSVLQPFMDRLKKDPNDAEANLKIGEHFGHFKGNWARAMPLLAKSKAQPLASLAQQDLVGPKDAKEQAALADAWWDFAVKQPPLQQARLQERAAYWYDKALPTLAGLSRTKAQKRLEQVAARSVGIKSVALGPVGFIKPLDGHHSVIRALAISHDGHLALSGSDDNTMRLWDLHTFKEVQTFKGHSKQVNAVAFLPGSKDVFSASWDTTVKLWDVATGNSLQTFIHPLDVNAITISADGKWMLTGCDDKHMRLWDLAKKEPVKKFAAHGDFCYACAFAPNGLFVASGSRDRRAVVFELATDKPVMEVTQNNAVLALAFSPDSRYLFTCDDSAVRMWNLSTGREEKKFETPTPALTCMALTPDGKRLVTGGDDKIVRVWNVATGKEVTQFQGHTAAITAIAVSDDGQHALSGQSDGKISYWGLPPQ